MESKKWILGLVFVIVLVGLSIVGFSRQSKNPTGAPQVSGQTASANQDYFAEDAKVMLFYSDYCSWCIKEKEVLAKLAPEGYKVKPMNVGVQTDLWEKYQIKGTPTFIASNGDRLEGYQEYDKLKAWLDGHK